MRSEREWAADLSGHMARAVLSVREFVQEHRVVEHDAETHAVRRAHRFCGQLERAAVSAVRLAHQNCVEIL